jgi:proline racemase
VAVETGMVACRGNAAQVLIDTEAGPVQTVVRLEGGRVREVTLKWTPAFVVQPAQRVKVPEAGEVPLDIAVGAGNVFAIVEAAAVGLAVRREQVGDIAARGMVVRQAIADQLSVRVPGHGEVAVDNVILHESPDARGVSRNALVWGPGQVDAAPCGSGTCARLALLHHRGRLRVGDTMISEGLLGLSFLGRIADETTVADLPAILPEITGTAYITGTSQFFFDPDDPLRDGFLL